jgi:DeoR family transcriptional regulator of aga operon
VFNFQEHSYSQAQVCEVQPVPKESIEYDTQAKSTRKNTRAEQILKELLRDGTVSVDGLVATLGASPASVRRDLAALEHRGLVRRTYGGAELLEPMLYEPFRYDSSFLRREQHKAVEKRRIGLAAAELIKENDTVGFTAGTTTTQAARAIRHRQKINVITNAVNIAMELCNCTGLKTYVTGGFVQWAGAFSLVGQLATKSLQDVFMDKVFIAVRGIDGGRGATLNEPDEAITFRTMVHQAKQTIVLADSTKLGVVDPALVCPLSDIDLLITDTGASDECIAPFLERGLRVMRV